MSICRTNVPKELMAFPDYRDFHGENRSCVNHKTVLEYLQNYTDHFNLRRYIQVQNRFLYNIIFKCLISLILKFETIVKKVRPILNDDNNWQQTKWRVESFNMNTKKSNDTICDAVMVCNGYVLSFANLDLNNYYKLLTDVNFFTHTAISSSQ